MTELCFYNLGKGTNMHSKNKETLGEKPSVKRKGRLRKGEIVETTGHKTMTMEEAFKSVEGMKHKIANKYKVFCNAAIAYEDIISAANVGLAWAYRDWDANTAKFITFSHNRMERQIDLYLCEMLPRYKNNVDAKNWLRRKNNESYGNLVELGYTVDKAFNEKYGLDGEKPFTKEHYNLYTQKVANQLFNNGNDLIITNASGFTNDENDEFDIFSIFVDERQHFEELDQNFKHLSTTKIKIVKMINAGFTISEIAKKIGVTRTKLFKIAGVEEY